ncbi:MAG: tyrosine-type recombinase/integrase [Hyphomicrobiales bacterium]|nr:tyrosine-type recombinase/integrase [Hyphomicrobiales bacterium]MDE2114161.1 tyrosine-type recombinase/integrase [Hyphomicrobiales bacterium]
MALTDVQIRAAQPNGKLKKLSDSNGLQLWLVPSGSKLWRFAYRFGQKQKILALGDYPEIGLASARSKRDEAEKLLNVGIDPSAQRKIDRLIQHDTNSNTFDLVARELMDKKRREGKAESTLTKVQWLLSLASPHIGQRPIAAISVQEVIATLRTAENRGRLETARRMRSTIGEVFRFAIQTGRAQNDPTSALRGALIAPTVKHRSAILDPKGVGALLRAIEGYDSPDVRAALQLLLMTMTRPGELRLAQWSEFDFVNAVWIIPSGRMKMRQEHRVPLSRQALALLQGLKSTSGDASLLFPSYRGQGRPMSEATMNAALKRLGYSSEQVQPHGFRTIASSLLNESNKFSPDAIERALSHKDRDTIRGTYSRGAYWDERVRMAQYWADHIDSLKAGGEVIFLDRINQNTAVARQ